MELSLSLLLLVVGGAWLLLSLIAVLVLWAACYVGSERRRAASAAPTAQHASRGTPLVYHESSVRAQAATTVSALPVAK